MDIFRIKDDQPAIRQTLIDNGIFSCEAQGRERVANEKRPVLVSLDLRYNTET